METLVRSPRDATPWGVGDAAVDVEPVCASILAEVGRTFLSIRLVIERRRPRVPRGLLNALCLGVLRNYKLLAALLESCGGARLPRIPRGRRQWLLLVGAYEAVFRRQVSVERIVDKTGLPREAAGCLRNAEPALATRGKPWLERLSILYSIPRWVVERLARLEVPGGLEALLKAFQEPTPLWLRLNRRAVSRNEALAVLREIGIEAEPDEKLDDMVMVRRAAPGAIEKLPRRLFYPQDRAAALPAHMASRLGLSGPVVDLFSAPGNKLAHLAWRIGGVDAAALDISARRLASERELHRAQGVAANTYVAGDARRPPIREGAAPLIIVDPDCTSIGRIGHSPETRLFLEAAGPSLVSRLRRLQEKSLREAARLLRRGGAVIYSTCTLTLEENEEVVEKIVGEGILEPIDTGVPVIGVQSRVPGAQRIYPHVSRCTGGFSAALRKP